MIIEPRVRDYICTTAHPVGCRENVKRQIEITKRNTSSDGFKKVLVIGASTGYGLAARISAAYLYGASTIGIMFEKEPSEKRTATAGFYNTAAFEEYARQDGLYAETINGDAFSKDMKDKAAALIKKDLGKVDLVIYSLAAPRRTMPDGTVYRSALKTTEGVFTNKSWDLRTNTIKEASIQPAVEDEIAATVKVMGGEDWTDWIEALSKAEVLEQNVLTIAFSYIGPKLTYPVYFNGTIGKAKEHLYQTSLELNKKYSGIGLKAGISVNKALVTQSSSAIPIVPLYMAILYKVMKENGTHEGCIEQMNRLFTEKLQDKSSLDEKGRIRLDDFEMQEEVQKRVMELWEQTDSENIKECADIEGYWEDFYHMFGFQFDNVDYTEDICLVSDSQNK